VWGAGSVLVVLGLVGIAPVRRPLGRAGHSIDGFAARGAFPGVVGPRPSDTPEVVGIALFLGAGLVGRPAARWF